MHGSEPDEHFMRLALELAQRGRGSVEPNPMVGCLIVRDQVVLGQGFHGKFGGPHAEVEALGDVSPPSDAKDSTAYVTLEPCCHHGKTPPCCDALIKAGIGRVVVAMEDPFPKVDGGGLARLRDAGIETVVGVLKREAEFLLAPYLKRIRTKVPWVIAKWAMTADGRIATASGNSQWITGSAARAAVHQLRARVDAIVVGMGTVDSDDPLLTARPAGPRVATRVVFCRNRLPKLASKLVASAADVPLLLVVSPSILARRIEPLLERSVDVFRCQSSDPAEMVNDALREMGGRGMTNVMVEGGSELLSSFFAANQVDECHLYLGAKAFGGERAPGPIGGKGIDKIEEAMLLTLVSVDRFDDDVRVIYRKSRD